MKDYLIQFKPFLLFLSRFIAAYLVLTVLYQFYLNQFGPKEADGITRMVAFQSKSLLSVFDPDVDLAPNWQEPGIKLLYHGKWVARIIEGCNAVSIIILFISFVVAFTGKFRRTVFFILGGILLIHICNIIRIALLAMAIFHYPQYEHWLHGVLFPLIIYGVVFGLWIIWVNTYSFYAQKTTTP